jgi:maltose alpha-D-glucosyltransferase / alpha-amylase
LGAITFTLPAGALKQAPGVASRSNAEGAIDDWYKDAVIYEVPVRAFADSNGDGIGDFRGLTGKLDYLHDLGVTALWLLPFYPSPLRDDGYDVTGYTDVDPACGTLRDFQEFLHQAHRRGLRVISDLVLNHTSDRHPWFRRARRAPVGSAERDFYVWSDRPSGFQQARVIFSDSETSNWAWDEVAGAWYWHRFYRHQPDLNFDNPDVRRTIFEVVDFWLRMGVDGLRLDAVPFLFERAGTSCENLPETHRFLRDLRVFVEERFPGTMLLAEANQRSEEAAAYFGEGDQVHMAFHFPLMPRMFLAAATEDPAPVVDILTRTPPIREPCQWALFLRNHDELSLEMVSEEERGLLYRAYAEDRRARLNEGIRRRLAPLLGNRRAVIELMNGVLFSLPGTPVIYYGDEIGMGDDLDLPDRRGIRTPMQWGPGENAGFSTCVPGLLSPPVILDHGYGPGDVNVEAQRADRRSLWHWMQQLISVRRGRPVFARGSLTILDPGNRYVLAFLRELGEERVLVVANLSARPQSVQVPDALSEGAEVRPLAGEAGIEAGGRTGRISLEPHAFSWLSLEREPLTGARVRDPALETAG